MRCLKMRIESPFFDKSSERFILTRARGLGFLTFDKIKKKVYWYNFSKMQPKQLKQFSFYQNRTSLKKTMSKIFLWEHFSPISDIHF